MKVGEIQSWPRTALKVSTSGLWSLRLGYVFAFPGTVAAVGLGYLVTGSPVFATFAGLVVFGTSSLLFLWAAFGYKEFAEALTRQPRLHAMGGGLRPVAGRLLDDSNT
ncbi:MAG: hypothetical protein KG075_23365 [Alphaproteobacteria bacterium]|nr:hypothetical protein [Alphaproteobacteria bacterium]